VKQASTSTSLSITSAKTTYGSESNEKLTTAVAVPAGLPNAPGTVTIKAGKQTLCTIALKRDAGGCTLAAAELLAGRHGVVATYVASTNFSSSSSKQEIVTVSRALSSSYLTLSHTGAAYSAEQSLKFTARVADPAKAPLATGRIAVTTGSRTLCTITLVHGEGTCSPTDAALPPGSYLVFANYAGSAELLPSKSSTKALVITRSTA